MRPLTGPMWSSWTTGQRSPKDRRTWEPPSETSSTWRSPGGWHGGANPREGPTDERTNENIPDRDLGSRVGTAVLQGAARLAGHGHRVIPVPRVPGRGRGRDPSHGAAASVRNVDRAGRGRDRGDRRGCGRALRDQLRPVAGDREPRRPARDPDWRGDRGREVHDRHAAGRAARHRSRRRDRRDPRGHAGDAVERAHANVARVIIPGRSGAPGAPDEDGRRADARLPRADRGRLGRGQRPDRSGRRRRHQHRHRGSAHRPGVLRNRRPRRADPRSTVRGGGRRRGPPPIAFRGPRRCDGLAARDPVRRRIRRHPPATALRQEPGARPRGARDPQLQLRSVDRRGDRPGHGARHRTCGGAAHRRSRHDRRKQRTGEPEGGENSMKLFLDTASIEEIREINRWGVLGGVTTNPSLLQKEAAEPEKVWRQILDEVSGDVSLEVTAPHADGMVAQGRTLAVMGPNAVVKVPMTPDGLEAGTRLVSEGIRINVTLVFSPAQAILAAEAGAYIVSPFLGRVDDVASDGMALLDSICDIYAVQGYETKVLAASLRQDRK